jgi:hypothetical protein
VEGSGHGIFKGTIRAFICRDWGNWKALGYVVSQLRFKPITSEIQARSITAWVNLLGVIWYRMRWNCYSWGISCANF